MRAGREPVCSGASEKGAWSDNYYNIKEVMSGYPGKGYGGSDWLNGLGSY